MTGVLIFDFISRTIVIEGQDGQHRPADHLEVQAQSVPPAANATH